MSITRIISGGQTGADQAGLAAAKELGLKTGGWMPKNYRTDAGPRPDFFDLYGMLQHTDYSYPPRTEMNVFQSGGTLIFGNEHSPGCSLTKKFCFQTGRDLFIVPWKPFNPVPDPEPFSEWIQTRPWVVLNVAGNRERTNPGIFDACKAFLISAFTQNKDK